MEGWLVGWICSLAAIPPREIDTTTQKIHQSHKMQWQPYHKEGEGEIVKQSYPSRRGSPSGYSPTARMFNGAVDEENSPVVANKMAT